MKRSTRITLLVGSAVASSALSIINHRKYGNLNKTLWSLEVILDAAGIPLARGGWRYAWVLMTWDSMQAAQNPDLHNERVKRAAQGIIDTLTKVQGQAEDGTPPPPATEAREGAIKDGTIIAPLTWQPPQFARGTAWPTSATVTQVRTGPLEPGQTITGGSGEYTPHTFKMTPMIAINAASAQQARETALCLVCGNTRDHVVHLS